MKKIILSIVAMLATVGAFAQVPQGFNYQAVIRDNNGLPLANKTISLRFSIRNTAVSGTVLYQETQTLNTNAQGLVNCTVGAGTVVSGSYPSENQWNNGAKFLQIEADPAGGTSYVQMATVQLMAVPFAHYSGSSGRATNADTLSGNIQPTQITGNGAVPGQVLKWDGSSWIPDVDNSGGSGGSDNWGTQTVITNSTLSGNGTSGNALRIAQQGAQQGQVLKWNGSTWVPAPDSAGALYTGGTGITMNGTVINSNWTANSNDIFNNNSGNTGIGNSSPAFKLDVGGDTRFSGNLGVGGTSPDANFIIKSSGTGNREMLLDATGTANYSALQLRSNVGVNDVLTLKKYGQSASGTYTDGTALARSAAVIAGNSASRLVLGVLGTSADLHLMTGSRTRLQIDKDGNMFSGNGLSSGAKLHLTKGTNGYIGPTGSYFAPSLHISMDTTVNGFYSAAVTGYASSDLGAVGGFFSAGRNSPDTVANYGVYGEAMSELSSTISYAYGTYGYGSGARYNYGSVGNALATRGSTINIGMYGYGSGETKSSTGAYGVYGYAEKGSQNYAGYFGGTTHVQGTFTATTKTFLIDHPLDPANKYLQFTCIESPDMLNIYNGNITTDANGFATVQLPDYFEAANIDFKYQLTVMGQFAQAIVSQKIQDNRFVIQTDKPNVEVSWQVTGIRNDEYARQNRIVPEYEKSAEHKGKYLHPELYKMPEEMGIHYVPVPVKSDGVKKQ